MNTLWTYFWPLFALGLVLGGILGSVWLRRGRRLPLAIGLVLALAGAALWHGPFGAADRFATVVERSAQRTLTDYEMTQVNAQLHRGPLSRRLLLSGTADDFQRSELVRIMSDIPGVSRATWSRCTPPARMVMSWLRTTTHDAAPPKCWWMATALPS